jgi:hypothetical protein
MSRRSARTNTTSGSRKGAHFSFFPPPTPNQGFQLGTIQASCRLTHTGELVGQWTSSLGTAGVCARRLLDIHEQRRRTGSWSKEVGHQSCARVALMWTFRQQ